MYKYVERNTTAHPAQYVQFTAQPRKRTFTAYSALTEHADFQWTNPNKVYATVCGFARASFVGFHAPDGAGYAFVADAVLKLDAMNPQVAARVADAFTTWRKYDAARQALMRAQLERIAAHTGLSPNVKEIASKSLK